MDALAALLGSVDASWLLGAAVVLLTAEVMLPGSYMFIAFALSCFLLALAKMVGTTAHAQVLATPAILILSFVAQRYIFLRATSRSIAAKNVRDYVGEVATIRVIDEHNGAADFFYKYKSEITQETVFSAAKSAVFIKAVLMDGSVRNATIEGSQEPRDGVPGVVLRIENGTLVVRQFT